MFVTVGEISRRLLDHLEGNVEQIEEALKKIFGADGYRLGLTEDKLIIRTPHDHAFWMTLRGDTFELSAVSSGCQRYHFILRSPRGAPATPSPRRKLLLL